MSEYSQTRSFNVGIATDVSIEAAMIYDDLAYAQKVFGTGYFYRSDQQMLLRFPMMTKNTMRRHVAKLVAAGWISTKVKKVDGKPVLNYQIEQILLPKMGKTMGIPKMGKTTIYKETKEQLGTSAPKRKDQEQELLLLVNKITGRSFRVLPERGVKKTLDSFTLAEIETALAALAADEWHKEKLHEFKIDYLIRSTTIDKFLNAKPKVDPRSLGLE